MGEADSRQAQIGRLSRFLKRSSRPRFQVFLILLLTASVGAGTSFALLKAGLTSMALRYPCAALVGYLTFLTLLRLWAEWHLSAPALAMEVYEAEPEAGLRSKTSVWDHVNPLDFLDLGVIDVLPLLILVLAVLAVVIVVIGVIVAAPVLLAELLLDGLLVTGLWHRFKEHGHGSTLGAAVRATVLPAAIVIVSLGVIGFFLQSIAPGADSIGDLFRSW